MASSADPRVRARISALLQLLAFPAVTGTLSAVIISQIARFDFSDTYRVTALFDDVSGLVEGDKAKIAGAPVGQVGTIRVRDAISQRVVYLLPGTAAERLEDGDEIRRTRSVVDIGDLVNRLEPLTRDLDPAHVNQILTSVYLALEGNEDDVSRLLANVDRLSATLASRRQTIKTMLEDYAALTGIIAKRDKQIAKATDDLVTLTPGPCPFEPKLVGSTERPAESPRALQKLLLGGG